MEKPLDVKALAELLGMSTKWVHRGVAAGLLPHTRLPGLGDDKHRPIRFTEEHVRQILAADERAVA